MRFNGAVVPESVQAQAYCAMDGLGERIAVRLMEGMPSELVSGTDFTVISEDNSAAGDITDVATGKA